MLFTLGIIVTRVAGPVGERRVKIGRQTQWARPTELAGPSWQQMRPASQTSLSLSALLNETTARLESKHVAIDSRRVVSGREPPKLGRRIHAKLNGIQWKGRGSLISYLLPTNDFLCNCILVAYHFSCEGNWPSWPPWCSALRSAAVEMVAQNSSLPLSGSTNLSLYIRALHFQTSAAPVCCCCRRRRRRSCLRQCRICAPKCECFDATRCQLACT